MPETLVAPVRDFRLLDADAPAAAALAAIQASGAAWVIVRRQSGARPEPLLYLFERKAILEKLAGTLDGTLGTVLRLSRVDPAPTRHLAAGTAHVMPGCILLAGGVPVALMARPAHVMRAGTPVLPPAGPVDDAAPVERVRELHGAWPARVSAGGSLSLLVSLASLGEGLGTATGEAFTAPVGARIDVVVRPLEGLTLVGDNGGTLTVAEPQPDDPLQFRFKAANSGTGRVRVYAWLGGASVGAFSIETSIGDASPPATTAHGAGSGNHPAPPLANVEASTPVAATPRTPPDLSLLITENDREIRCRLQRTDGGGASFGTDFPPVVLELDTRSYFRDFAADIDRLKVGSGTERDDARRKLELWGARLFRELLPAGLQSLLWQQRERVASVQVTSDETWIPWEVCRLGDRDGDGRAVEGSFFAEAFAFTRWLHGSAAPRTFRFDRWALVAPQDTRLPKLEDEQAFILKQASRGRVVTQVRARFADVSAAFEAERFDAFHFCGHAHAGTEPDADKSAIELENREVLTADLFAGRMENALRTGPFVFFNACQSGQGGRGLTGAGGWARRFVRPSFPRYAAAAFVGTWWSVVDDAALAFTQALYPRLLARMPIGEAVRAARADVNTASDPLTWLAYTVYADPLAAAEESPQ